mgnify:CR=1 FL=1
MVYQKNENGSYSNISTPKKGGIIHAIGEIYIQYPGEADPNTLFPNMTWQNVSSNYVENIRIKPDEGGIDLVLEGNIKGFAVKLQVCGQIVKIGILGNGFRNGIGTVRCRIRFAALCTFVSASCHQQSEQKKKRYLAFHMK